MTSIWLCDAGRYVGAGRRIGVIEGGAPTASTTQDADTQHPRPGFGTWAVAAARGEHHIAARPEPVAPVDKLARDDVIAFLTFVHVHLGPFRAGGEVIHPAPRPLAGRQPSTDDSRHDLDRIDVIDLDDSDVFRRFTHSRIVVVPAAR
jgi:hypothetical protein